MLGEYLGAGTSITKALYHLENTTDSSGNGNTLTNNNSVAFNAAKFGNGADFGSSNSNKSLQILNNLGISNTSITMSCWSKRNAEISTGIQTFFAHNDSTTRTKDYVYYDYNGGTRRLIFSHTKNFVGSADVVYNITLGTNNWYHLAYVFDGTNVYAYLNGLYLGTASTTGNGTTQGHNSFAIGGLPNDNGTGFNNYSSSIIDEVIVENRVWSAEEVKKYYTYASGRFHL